MEPLEIKDLRKSKKLTQSELGSICGVTKASVSRWESGKDKPRGSVLKILKFLKDGDLVVTNLSELEMKLLDENVRYGNFASKEDYLTASLKHLLTKGEFMDISKLRSTDENYKDEGGIPSVLFSPDTSARICTPIVAEVIDWSNADDTVRVKMCGESMSPSYPDGMILVMKHKRSSRSPYMKKGKIYLIQLDGVWLVKRYNTRLPNEAEQGAEYLTDTGEVAIMESINPDYPEIPIISPFEWVAWLP